MSVRPGFLLGASTKYATRERARAASNSKEIKAKHCRAGVSHQFGRINLVEEYLVIQGHRALLERSRADGQRLDLRPALCHELRSRVVDAGEIWTNELLG
jgi:hypothetical protein